MNRKAKQSADLFSPTVPVRTAVPPCLSSLPRNWLALAGRCSVVICLFGKSADLGRRRQHRPLPIRKGCEPLSEKCGPEFKAQCSWAGTPMGGDRRALSPQKAGKNCLVCF